MKNTGTNTAGILSWRSDLRNVQIHPQPPDYRTYSPEVTEQARNLPVHRSLRALWHIPFHTRSIIV